MLKHKTTHQNQLYYHMKFAKLAIYHLKTLKLLKQKRSITTIVFKTQKNGNLIKYKNKNKALK